MAVYDSLGNMLTRFGRWIVRQTKGSYKSARLSHVIREEERKQDDLFRQIGEYYYQMYGKDADDSVPEPKKAGERGCLLSELQSGSADAFKIL